MFYFGDRGAAKNVTAFQREDLFACLREISSVDETVVRSPPIHDYAHSAAPFAK